jgi:hypothetical protein
LHTTGTPTFYSHFNDGASCPVTAAAGNACVVANPMVDCFLPKYWNAAGLVTTSFVCKMLFFCGEGGVMKAHLKFPIPPRSLLARNGTAVDTTMLAMNPLRTSGPPGPFLSRPAAECPSASPSMEVPHLASPRLIRHTPHATTPQSPRPLALPDSCAEFEGKYAGSTSSSMVFACSHTHTLSTHSTRSTHAHSLGDVLQ